MTPPLDSHSITDKTHRKCYQLSKGSHKKQKKHYENLIIVQSSDGMDIKSLDADNKFAPPLLPKFGHFDTKSLYIQNKYPT